MKINIQKVKNFTKRFIPVLTALFVFVCCIAFPVFSAEHFDYNDYITNIVADGDNDIVTFEYPVDRSTWYVALSDGSDGILSQGGKIERWFSRFGSYLIECRPFGGQINDFNNVRCDNIPDGTILEGSYYAGFESAIAEGSPFGIVQWYSSTGTILSNQRFEVSRFPSIGTDPGVFSVVLDKPTGATSFAVLLRVDNFTPLVTETVTLELLSCKFTMSISSLYRQQQLTGETNNLLDEVNRQLEEQGKTLDEILNGTPEQNEQANQFRDDMDSAIGDLDSAGDVLNSVEKPSVSADSFVPNQWLTGTDYLIYTSVINNFWSSDILSNITMILGGMLIISYLLFGEKG